ncbi:chromosome transmission fidelity protein 18 homolog [Erythrolamprus reginae]|uniref:chromosome transmission fidelity protein 18 homolog n=1 Tax=Erythrolamprus reginae TaxID=121349 RepID=UPI00396CFDD0
MEDYEPELYGIEDEFEAQFADELEVLAELEDPALPVRCSRASKSHSWKRTFEEALSAGDLVKEKDGPDRVPPKKTLDEGSPKCEGPEHPPTSTEMGEDGLLQNVGTVHTPKPKRRRLEVVKRLDFGQLNGDVSEDSPPRESSAPTLSPNDLSENLDARNPRPDGADQGEISDIVLLRATPPGKKSSGKILKRPPILQDYINVTSTNGTRVFMVVKEDGVAAEFASSVSWKRQRSLHLLGVPFAYLKEQVMEERQKQILESSEQLMKVLSRLGAEDPEEEAPGPNGEEEGRDRAEAPAQHSLWVDQFTPRRYLELLSDDYTNRCLLKWLKLWDLLVFGKEKPCRKAPLPSGAHPPPKPTRDQGTTRWKTKAQVTEEALEAELDQHNRPKFKIALLCGPPGLGKTTLAHVIAKHAGYNVVEMNASDDRSPEIFQTQIEAATQMKSVLGASEKPNCLVIDEIDGAPTASINVLLSIVNQKAGMAESEGQPSGPKSRGRKGLLLRPIICICNDQYVPALRLLKQQAFLLHFPSTLQSRLVQRLHEIAVMQGMKADIGALTILCEKTDNDIRSCINTLQFLYGRGKTEVNVRTVQAATVGLKDRNKGLFSIWQEIFQLPKVRRKNLGMDPSLPASLLLSGAAADDVGRGAGQAAISTSAQQFHRILHLSVSSGEYEKLSQGLYDNFLHMKVKDHSLDSVCLALEWLGFSDLLGKAILGSQSFQLMRYLPFLPVSFHLLFAASSIPRLTYPHSQHEALSKLTQMHHLVDSMISGIAPNSRSRVRPQSFTLEALCLLLEIISPKLRPVNTQLYSQREKEQLSQLINVMLTYNLTYHQERTPEGQYVYKLDPNVEEVCRFPDLPLRKPLTYQAKQLIAREIQVEKMRQMEAPRQALEAKPLPTETNHKTGTGGERLKSRVRNHEQRLDQIVKRATIEEKPERDFFGQVILKKKKVAAPLAESDQVLEQNTVEKQIGKAVGQSDVWFRFNEGVSNAVRRNIYIKDLL